MPCLPGIIKLSITIIKRKPNVPSETETKEEPSVEKKDEDVENNIETSIAFSATSKEEEIEKHAVKLEKVFHTPMA